VTRRWCGALLGVCVFVLVGCIPRERLVWSPDGSKALVRMSGERWFVLEGPELRPRDLGVRASAMCWLPDNRRALAVVVREHERWNSLKACLSDEQVRRVRVAARKLADAFLAFAGPVEEFDWQGALGEDRTIRQAVLLCLRDTARPELRKKLGEKWKELAAVTAWCAALRVLDTSGGRKACTRPAAFASMLVTEDAAGRGIRAFVDPTGKTAALLVPDWDQNPSPGQMVCNLGLCAIGKDGPVRMVERRVGWYVAWSPDGHRLAYFRPGFGEEGDGEGWADRLGSLYIRRVAYEPDGRLARKQPEPDKVVSVIFYAPAMLAFAGDGSLLFAAMELHLPATEGDGPQGWTLFRWDPDYPGLVSRVLNRQAIGATGPLSGVAWLFALSPSGRRVVCYGGQKVYLYDLRSGEAEALEGIRQDEHGLVPIWRNERQIALMVGLGERFTTPRRSEIVLLRFDESLQVESVRGLSRDWPDEWVEDWFEFPQAASQPAVGQAGSPGRPAQPGCAGSGAACLP